MIDYKYCGIYTITHTKTGEMYIGSSIDMMKRMRKHISDLIREKHANYKLQYAFNDMVQNMVKTDEPFSFDFRFEPYHLVQASDLDEYEDIFIKSLYPAFNIDTKIQRNSNRLKSIRAHYSSLNDREAAFVALLKVIEAAKEREKLNNFYAECRSNKVYEHSMNEFSSDEILFQIVKYVKSIKN
jgi:GIY-YIG catalytic domain